jgi:hypothetical protein
LVAAESADGRHERDTAVYSYLDLQFVNFLRLNFSESVVRVFMSAISYASTYQTMLGRVPKIFAER